MNEPATLVLGLGATGYSCIRHLAGRERLQASNWKVFIRGI